MKRRKRARTRYVLYLSAKVIRVIEDIVPLFIDKNADKPMEGVFRRTLEFMIMQCSTSQWYLEARQNSELAQKYFEQALQDLLKKQAQK